MNAPAFPHLSRLLTSILPVLVLAGCGQGDGPEAIFNQPATPLPELPAGFCDPINFSIFCSIGIEDFGGGETTIIENPLPDAVNDSETVAQMLKRSEEVFGGTRLNRDDPYDFSNGEAFTIKVRANRSVPVTFKLEQQNREEIITYSDIGNWEELCVDFSGAASGAANSSISVIFDITVLGAVETDPQNWTFYYDDITQVASCPGGGLPANYSTITFDDPALSYRLSGFGGADDSTIVADPDDAMNQVVQVNRSATAESFAGTTVALGPNQAVPDIPLDAMDTEMSVRVRAPGPNIPVRLKIENASDDSIFTETEVLTNATDTWETLTFDFSMQAMGVPAFDPAATYNKITIFFNFGTVGATAGAQTYYFDDIAVGAGGGGGGGTPITPQNVVFASDPGITEDLAIVSLDNFGSGATFDTMFAGDADFNPAIQVTSGADFGGEDVGFIAFTGYAPGFAATFDNFVFKVKANAANLTNFEVKFIGGTDTSMLYDLTTYSGTSDLGNGWLQVEIPMSDVDANIGVNNGFLVGPLGDQGAPYSYLLTDIGFAADAGGGGTPITPQNVVYATDPGITEDLAIVSLDNFGSGATFDTMFAGDADFNPAIQVTSGADFGGEDVGFIAFTGYTAGFAATFDNFVFKVKADAANQTNFEVKFIGGTDTSMLYDLTTYSGTSDLGNGWLQVEIPMSDVDANIGVNNGFLVGPLGDQGAPYSYLLTDIGFTTGGGPSGPGEQTVNGDVETGDLGGFEIFPNGGTITAVNTENNTMGGTWSINVVAGTGNNPTVKQERLAAGLVMPNQMVSLSFAMKGTTADGGVINVELINEDSGGAAGVPLETIVTPTAGWTTYTYTPMAGAAVDEGITFQIAVVCGGAPTCSANVFIDDISVVVN